MIWTGIVMGVLATILMDIWTLLLNSFAQIPLPNWGAVGRWVYYLKDGRIFHASIADAPEVVGEASIGWMFHYAVGIVYGIALAVLMGPDWLANPTFAPAWVFSILTVGFGWFLLQPGLGLGWAASNTPAPWKVRGLNILAHTVFGLGLWVGAFI